MGNSTSLLNKFVPSSKIGKIGIFNLDFNVHNKNHKNEHETELSVCAKIYNTKKYCATQWETKRQTLKKARIM